MAGLPDVTFTNRLGTVSFKRCLIGLSDSWDWNGQAVRYTKSINLDGWVERSTEAPEGLEAILTQPSTVGRYQGDLGTLTLPWTVLRDVKIGQISYPEGPWLDWSPIQVTFLDECPQANRYTLSFFGLTLHNPRLTIPVPLRAANDQYPQMPWLPTGSMPTYNPWLYVMRTKQPFEPLELTLGGGLVLEEGKLPLEFVERLSQRAGTTSHTLSTLVPAGYPRPFSLREAVPELSEEENLAHCFVQRASFSWDIERQLALVRVSLLAPPQRLEIM